MQTIDRAAQRQHEAATSGGFFAIGGGTPAIRPQAECSDPV